MKTLTILFIVTSHALMGNTGEPTGVWFEEIATPYYALKDAGYDVKIASIKGGEIPIDPRSKLAIGENPESVDRFLQDELAMDSIQDTPSINDVDASQYAAIFMPGGHGTMWDLPNNERLASIVSETLADGRVVAAVCHGPAGLVSAKDSNGAPFVKGRKVATFTDSEEAASELTDIVPFLLETRLRELGADVQTGADFEAFAVADENLITGQNPASSEKVAELVIKYLEQQK